MKNVTMSDSTVRQGCLPLLVSDCLEETAEQYAAVWQLDESKFVHGKGKHKSVQQRQCKGEYLELICLDRLYRQAAGGGKKKNNSEKEHRSLGRSELFSGLVLPAGSSKTI